MDTENEFGSAKNRKRGSKKFDAMEETPFTTSYKPNLTAKEGNVEKPENPNPNCLQNTRCYFCDFCDNTSIHGLKFLGERGRYFIEKIFWLLVVTGAITGSGSLIYKTYSKWLTSPVVVTFAMTETPIWQIPFPAVTICPEYKINSTIFNYTEVFVKLKDQMNITKEEEEYYQLFSMVCSVAGGFTINDIETLTNDEFYDFYDGLADLSPDNCKWLGDEYECDDVLSTILTSEGLCRSFNMLDPEEIYVEVEDYLENHTLENTKVQKWSLEKGYPPTAELDTYPRRTILSGSKTGFQLDLLVLEDDLDYVCAELQGFKVTLHHPAEEPDMDKHFRIPLDQAVIAGIKPRMISTSEEIRGYSWEDRQCYLSGEKVLSTFKIYTQQNCMAECLTNYTLHLCGCIPFYTSYIGDPSYCAIGSKDCMEKAKVTFLTIDVTSKINKTGDDGSTQCGCLPACTSLEFDSETSQTDWNWRKNIEIQAGIPELKFDLERIHFSRLSVYYKEMQFMTSERHELYGVIDFLANCGGLLGLFCGFSFTSSMEILYYLTLRFVCNLKKFGRRVWSGAPELLEEEEERRKEIARA